MRKLLSAAMAVLVCASAAGLYRGDEFEPRGWTYGPDYDIDLLTYQSPRRMVRRYRESEDGLIMTGGSTSVEELWLDARYKSVTSLDAPWRVHFLVERGQDWDGTFEHYRLEAETPLAGEWSLYVAGEPLPEKEFIDFGFGLRFDNEDTKIDMRLLWPNLYWNQKNDLDSRVEKRAVNLKVTAEIPAGRGVILPWTEIDFPNEYSYNTDNFMFDFKKYKFGMDYELPLANDALFWAGFSTGLTGKQREGFAAGDPEDFSIDRDTGTFQAEYSVHYSQKHSLGVGFYWTYLNEDEPHPNDPASDRFLLTNVYAPYFFWTVKADRGRSFTTGIYAGYRDFNREFPGGGGPTLIDESWQVKAPLMLKFKGAKAELILNVTVQLQPDKFGGGNIIFQAVF